METNQIHHEQSSTSSIYIKVINHIHRGDLTLNKTLKITGIITGLGLIFGIGSIVGASSDWKTNAINSAYSELLDSASKTTTEIKNEAPTEINATIQNGIKSTVDEQQAELERLLEQYYQLKLKGLTESAEFLALEEQIKLIQKNVLDSYKQQIDEAFTNSGN